MMQFLKDSFKNLLKDRLVEQQMHKPDAYSWNISRNYVIMDQISRHVDKCDVPGNSQHSFVRENLVLQTY